MGLYNVVAPCVVGELHFTRRSAKPIEVDDQVALPLVAEGKLESAGILDAPALGVDFEQPFALAVDDESADRPSRKRRRPAAEGEDGE